LCCCARVAAGVDTLAREVRRVAVGVEDPSTLGTGRGVAHGRVAGSTHPATAQSEADDTFFKVCVVLLGFVL
jgi:hypothetical protein